MKLSPCSPLAPQPVALALSGGGGRSFYQLGALQAMHERGFGFGAVAGCSSGAILGALLAAGYSPSQIQEMLRESSPMAWFQVTLGQGLVQPRGLEEWLSQKLPPTFEELQLPLIIPATNIETGAEVVFDSGELLPAIMASSAFTGAVHPLLHQGQWLTDGGLVSEVPATLARRISTLPLVAMDATAPLLELDFSGDERGGFLGLLPSRSPSLVQVLMQAFTITQGHLTACQIAEAAPEWLVDFHDQRGVQLHQLDELEYGVHTGYQLMQEFMQAGALASACTEASPEASLEVALDR